MSDNGDKRDNDKNDVEKDNVVPFAKPKPSKTSEKSSKIETKIIMPQGGATGAQPLINLPPVTKYLLALIVVIHVAITLLMSEEDTMGIYTTYGFVPAYWNSNTSFSLSMLASPFTHMLLHGSWLHIIMNSLMLMAFGSGVERHIGAKKMIFILVFSGLCGIGLQYALDPASIFPVIGASGGISGLFAAAFVMITRDQSRNSGQSPLRALMPFIILWIVISLVFGFLGSPDGNAVAWAAHLGGFFGGFAALKILKLI